MDESWNPWHGCHKLSPGCVNCYVYRIDARHERDSSIVQKTGNFNLPVRKNRAGEYKIPAGTTVYTCFTSDFLLEDADEWRQEAWGMMRERSDLRFLFITKRIDRLAASLPLDWLEGYENVAVGCTVENQDRADYRLPIFRAAPIKHKFVICEPLLEGLDLRGYLGNWVEKVVAGGESGLTARPCRHEWILDLRAQCISAGIPFWFKQTGARYVKDGRLYPVPRKLQHAQARKSGLSYTP